MNNNKKKHLFFDENVKKRIILKKIKKYNPNTTKKEWRLKEKLALLDIVASNLQMTGHNPTVFREYEGQAGNDQYLRTVRSGQKDRAKDIILSTDFRKLYRGGPGRKTDPMMIITGICCKIMREDNPRRGDIPYSNKFIRSVGLNKDIYDHISKKIDELREEDQSDKPLYNYEEENENLPDIETFLSNFEYSDLNDAELQEFYESRVQHYYYTEIFEKIKEYKNKNVGSINDSFFIGFLLTIWPLSSFSFSFVLFTNLTPEDCTQGVVEYVDEGNITYYYPESHPNYYYTFLEE